MANGVCDAKKLDELKAVIEEYRGKKGPLMPVMQRAQDIFGYLPEEAQELIADELDVPRTKIYGIATFYAQFSLQPKGKIVVGVCMGTACYVRKASDVLDAIKKELGLEVGKTTEDGLFTLEGTRCLGCCGLAPVMMVNDDVYGQLTGKEVGDIIKQYRKRA